MCYSTHAGGVCRQELASNQRLREPVLATPLPCLQIEDHSSGGISADDNLALFRDKPGVSNYRQEAHTAVCHSETPEHLLGKYESSQLSDSHRLQFKHESLNPGWCCASQSINVPSSFNSIMVAVWSRQIIS